MTTLQKEILRFVLLSMIGAIVLSVVVIIVWASWLRTDHPEFLSTSGLIVAIVSVSVALIPEGTLTFTLLTRPPRCGYNLFDNCCKKDEEKQYTL
jgi:magnesium-transporting ATPase (P-type)